MERIKQLRKALGLSLADVGSRCGLHPEAIARIEHPNVDPRASSVAKVAKAMGVPVCAFFDEPGHHEPAGPRKRRR